MARTGVTVKALVLGAGGFIGSHAVSHLLAGDHHVTGLDVSGEKLGEVLEDATADQRRRWEFHEADVRTATGLLNDLVQCSDVVVDLMAHANPSLYVTHPLDVFELNFMQNLAIARLCVTHGKWLIQYSSAEVYGKATGGAYDEETSDSVFGPVRKQRWIYASAKQLLERVLYAHGEAGELRYTIVRPFNFLGPRIDYLVPAGSTGGPRVFPHFMSALLAGGPMHVVDGGHARRAFLDIRDGTLALQEILDQPARSQQRIFNVGNPENQLTILELAHLMIEVYTELTGTPPDVTIEPIDGEAFYGAGYEDSDREPPDISRMRALGWAPRYDLKATLRNTMTYYLDRRASFSTSLGQ